MILYSIDYDKSITTLIEGIDSNTDHMIAIDTANSNTLAFKHIDGTCRPIYMDINGKGMRKHIGLSKKECMNSPFYNNNVMRYGC